MNTLDKNTFFRDLTLRICGNLEIHKALHACMEPLSKVIPLVNIYIQVFEPELGAMRMIAKANKDKGTEINILIPLPKDVRERVTDRTKALGSTKTWIINDSTQDPVARNMLKLLGEGTSSILGMVLSIEKKPVGYLIIQGDGKNRFTTKHTEYLTLLKKPFYIALSNVLAHREVLSLKDLLLEDNKFLNEELLNQTRSQVIGSNFGLKPIMKMVRQVARQDSPVMLLGETGTGKDVIANAIHTLSQRRDKPFIIVNCGAIPESLIDAELFGYEKGAFTGAVTQKKGRFERAQKGTIFLDEIGELPLASQVRLLRVLQNKEIERIGGTGTISLDIRVIAATNRNIVQMVQEKTFRQDLWFRLNIFPINLPPLRDRRSDIPALLQHFLVKKAKELKLQQIPEIKKGSIDTLLQYTWPGNVRELENVVERALILMKDNTVSFKLLSNSPTQAPPQTAFDSPKDFKTLDEMNAEYIKKVLDFTNGKIHGPGGAAEILGINPNTLRNRMSKIGVPYKKND